MTTITITVERGSGDDWRELDVEVRGVVMPYTPAQTHGPPDFWQPDEGGEVEIESVTCGAEEVELTPRELTEASELLERKAHEDAAESRAARTYREHDSRVDGF